MTHFGQRRDADHAAGEEDVTVPADPREALALPPRIVVGANGAYWRDYASHYSMPPVSEDNEPVEVVAVYVRQPDAHDLRESIDAVADALNAWDRGEEPRPETHRHWSKIVAALAGPHARNSALALAARQDEPSPALREAAQAVLTELDVIRSHREALGHRTLAVHPDTHEDLRRALAANPPQTLEAVVAQVLALVPDDGQPDRIGEHYRVLTVCGHCGEVWPPQTREAEGDAELYVTAHRDGVRCGIETAGFGATECKHVGSWVLTNTGPFETDSEPEITDAESGADHAEWVARHYRHDHPPAAPRGYVDGVYHLTTTEYDGALRRAYEDGRRIGELTRTPEAEGDRYCPRCDHLLRAHERRGCLSCRCRLPGPKES